MNPRPRVLYVDHLCGKTSHNLFLDSLKLLDVSVVSCVSEALSQVNLAEQSQNIFDVLIMSNPYSAGPWQVNSPDARAGRYKSTISISKTKPNHIQEGSRVL